MKSAFVYALVALMLLVSMCIYSTCIKRTKGFTYAKIHSRYAYDHRWDFGPPSEKQKALLDQIAHQSFTLIGSGKECYAFVSDDGEIIIKFFKQKHMRTQYILNYIPLSKRIQTLRNEKINSHYARRKSLYQSCQIGYERLPEETGILYLHLTKTKNLNRTVLLKFSDRKSLRLKLDDIEFLVQKKVDPIFAALTKHPEKGKELIRSIVALIKARSAKGIGDRDINCARNLGVIGGKAMQIDVGEFYPSIPNIGLEDDLKSATSDLHLFLQKNHPELVSHLEAQIKSALLPLYTKNLKS